MSKFNRTLFTLALILTAQVSSAQTFPWPFDGVNDTPAKNAAAERLPGLNCDAKAVSVSGISAGAFMATQLQVAYSNSIMGVGSIAGGPWACSQGSAITAQTACMAITSQLNPRALAGAVKNAASAGEIDPIENLKTARVYLYNSPSDAVVRPPMNEKTKAFYEQFVDATNIKTETSIASAHGFPTLAYGNACASQGAPYLNNCGFDAAGELLKQIYGTRVQTRAPAVATSLHVVDQTEFTTIETMMDASGWVYIPEKCRVNGAHCPVHVALHGCLQAGEVVKDVFAVHAGYNEWAEGSGLIVLYPQTRKTSGNPNGCFDWWGYTNADYANKNGQQMKAIKAMIDRVVGS